MSNPRKPKARPVLRSEAAMIGPGQIAGFVLDPGALDRRFVVELLLDGYPTALGRADLYDPGLARENFGDGCFGFVFNLDPLTLETSRRIEIRLANSGEIVGVPLDAQAPPADSKDKLGGEIKWEGGLRFSGWVAGDPALAKTIRAQIDGEFVAEAVARRWTHVGEGASLRAFRRFDLHLPMRFADGRARAATFLGEDGAELPGSPCAFVAFPDGLARFLESRAEIETEKLRAETYDRLVPQSLPFELFEDWRRMFPLLAPGARRKVAVALIGDTDIEASVASLEAQLQADWVAAALEGGEGPLAFDSASLRQFLDGEASECKTVIFAPAGALLQPQALALLAQALDAFPSASLAYADFTMAAPDGREWPVALPAFDYELTLEQGCGALFFAARAEYVRAAAKAGASDLFRLFLFDQDRRRSYGERRGASVEAVPVHQPGFLARLPKLDLALASRRLARAVAAHLAARGLTGARISPGQGAVLPSARVARGAPLGKVSFLIPTRDRADLLRICFDSLARTVDLGRHEIVVLDNDSAEAETEALFRRMSARGARILKVGGPFNFARIVNKGASVATGEFLLLLNNDVEALQAGWLEEMLGRMSEPDVGAVGAALLWPSGVVQHGGVVLGPRFGAVHAFNDRIDSDPGYADLLRAAHERSAVTAACLLTGRRVFSESGGLDGSSFPVNFNDVDYCLKLRARGLRVVLTPHSQLVHRESASRGSEQRPDQTGRFERELRHLRAAWRDVLLADPAYHPMLSLDSTPYSALAWPPRLAPPRQPAIFPSHPIPPGF
jgi:GT2 family glycosyltransferase